MRGIHFPLKLTNSVDLINPFGNLITKKYGKDSFASVQKTFQDMQVVRNGLDYGKMTVQINNDYRLCSEFEGLTIRYLRYVYLLDNYFEKDFSNLNKPIVVPFTWTDSFQPKKAKQISSLKYELASTLYNAGILYYTEGAHYAASQSDQDKLKAIGKLSIAYWAFNEIKKILPSVMAYTIDIPDDINLTFINLLINYVIGMVYSILVELLASKKTPQELASVNKAAAKHFQMAFDIIIGMKKCPIPEKQQNELRANLAYNTAIFKSQAYNYIADTHLAKVDQEILQGHQGKALAYLTLARAEFQSLLSKNGDAKYLKPEQNSQLVNQANTINTKYEQVKLKNEKVYRQTVPQAFELPEIPEEKSPIQPLQPKEILEPIGCEQTFSGFIGPEVYQLKKEFKALCESQLHSTVNKIKDLQYLINDQYKESQINYLLNLAVNDGKSGGNPQLPAHLQSKIQQFKNNGGLEGYQQILTASQQQGTHCSDLMTEIRNKINQEAKSDAENRQKYGSKFSRPESSKVNQEYLNKLQNYDSKFQAGQNADKKVLDKYQANIEWMLLFSDDIQNVTKKIPVDDDTEFRQNNPIPLKTLADSHVKLSQKFNPEYQINYVRDCHNEFMKTDHMNNFIAMHQSKADKKEAFAKLIQPFKEKVKPVEQDIEQSYPLFYNIVDVANKINQSRPKNSSHPANNKQQQSIQKVEELALAADAVNSIKMDFDNGIKFYAQLGQKLQDLDATITDFVFARDVEAQAIVEEIEANNNYTNMNTSKPFFQQQSGFVPPHKKLSQNKPKPQEQIPIPSQPQNNPVPQYNPNNPSNYQQIPNQPQPDYQQQQQNMSYPPPNIEAIHSVTTTSTFVVKPKVDNK